MSANLVDISAAPAFDTPEREREVEDYASRRWDEFRSKLSQCQNPDLLQLFNVCLDAFDYKGRYWKRRARKAERTLCAVQDTDMPDDVRARVLGTLYGNTGQRLRNSHGLSDYEHQIVEHYRAADVDGRQLMRLLFERISGTNATEG